MIRKIDQRCQRGNALPIPLWPSPRPPQALILEMNLPSLSRRLRLRLSLCHNSPCTDASSTLPRALGASRPPIRSIGRRTRGNVIKRRLRKTPPRLPDARPARLVNPQRLEVHHLFQLQREGSLRNNFGDPIVEDQGQYIGSSGPERPASNIRFESGRISQNVRSLG